MSKAEYVELTVKVPKPIMDFVKAFLNFVGSPSYTAERFLREDCENHIKSFMEDFMIEACSNMFYDGVEEAVNKYGLKQFIDVKAVGVTC